LESPLPEDVKQFIRGCIDRLETLEVLLLLQASGRKVWTSTEVSERMRSSRLAIETALTALVSRGLVVQQAEGYDYQPQTPELDAAAVRLAACYREKRTAVISFIFSAPSDAVRRFAEAFRIKKGPTDG
jgi:hypothetical protein